MRYWLHGTLLLSALLLTCFPLAAAEVVFYRCTDAQGALTVQNMPCPKGMQQTRKVMQAIESPPPPPVPLTVAPAAAPLTAPAPEPPVPTAAMPPRKAAPRPLPPLLQCQTSSGESYFSEGEQAPSRCVAMRVTGLDGNPLTGAGEACEVVSDRCTPVTDDQACAVWQQRVQDAESHWRFATPGPADSRQREYQRLRDLLTASHCTD